MANDHPRLLLVDPRRERREALAATLTARGYALATAGEADEARRALARELFDAVLVDVTAPAWNGLAALVSGTALQTDTPFLALVGAADAAEACRLTAEAMRLGACVALPQPADAEELTDAIASALRARGARDPSRPAPPPAEALREHFRPSAAVRPVMVGASAPMQRLRDLIARAAPRRVTVLITGETGTGKELVARAIHDASPRAHAPFVPVNCSALPDTLLESELFGHVKGSFTGAIAHRRGVLEEAAGGTLFLDEVSALSPATQVKLLRVLQEHVIQRVGGNQAIPVDFRLVAATNVDLAAAVAQGRFRQDLFYRINVFPIDVPPLRARREDVPLLVAHFLERVAAEDGIEPPPVLPAALERMMRYEWPGNVRELENYVHRAAIMHAGARAIPFDAPAPVRAAQEPSALAAGREQRWSLAEIERAHTLAVLEETHGNQVRAAEILGIDRRTLYRRLKGYRRENALRLDAPAATPLWIERAAAEGGAPRG